MPIDQSIYIRRRGKVLPPPGSVGSVGMEVVAALSANIESLGYALSPPLFEALLDVSEVDIARFEKGLVQSLQKLLGADVTYKPMYRGFPAEVMDTSTAELYLNALIHYWTNGEYMPRTDASQRGKLFKKRGNVLMLGLGNSAEFDGLFTMITGANTAFSLQDREDIQSMLQSEGVSIWTKLPEKIPQKENVAHVAALMLRYGGPLREFLEKYAKTATDALRIAVALSGGDVSLAKATKFKGLARSQRRQLLEIIERCSDPLDDMVRRPEVWKRLGEGLHPGEYQKKFPRAAAAFASIRKGDIGLTFRGRAENLLRSAEIVAASQLLAQRPGELARRLDHLLRLGGSHQTQVLAGFGSVIKAVSTPVLLQVLHHFRTRSDGAPHRVFLPKGQVALAYLIPNTLPPLSEECCQQVTQLVERALTERFSEMPPLGKVFLDLALKTYNVPFGFRSASKALRTVARGSRIAMPACDTLRFFIWWKNGTERTDLDLSAVMLSDELTYVDHLTYYNLKSFSGCHSGDIVDAPEGACEFIDVNLRDVEKKKVRYVAMIVSSYTQQPYCDLPECFAGWMARTRANSGEIFEARTVQDRFDLSANSRTALPLLFDLKNREVIWCDMSSAHEPTWANNVHTQIRGIRAALKGLTELKKMSLYDLLLLHAQSRGTLVDSPSDADTNFSVAASTQYEVERIAAEFMA